MSTEVTFRSGQACSGCGRPVYFNGEGAWFGPGDRVMCSSCGPAEIEPAGGHTWNPEKGCWEVS